MNKISPEKEFHMKSRKELLKTFEVEVGKGLSSERAASLLKKHGKNEIKISYSQLYKAFFLDFVDILSILLWITLVLAILAYTPTGNPTQMPIAYLITAFLMFIILILKASLHAYQVYNSIKSMNMFQNDKESKYKVLRDGKIKLIECCNLTLGDLIYLEKRQRIPADLRIIEAKGLYIDRSILTGETENVEVTFRKLNIDNKTSYFDASNMAFTNCLVALGEGIGLVVDLSNNSHLGQISPNKLKPVKQRKRGVVQELSKFIISIFTLCLVGVIIYIVVYIAYLRPMHNPSAEDTANDVISIVIGGIPYGMPISITVGLFLVSRQLKKGKILVKNVFAIDSLSSVDVIITDKTGTITRNELVVSKVMQATKEIDPELCSFDEDFDQVAYSDVYIGVDAALRELLWLAYFNQNPNNVMNSIETALFDFAKKNLNLPELGKAYKIIDEIEFNSTNKYHVILLEPVDNDIHLKLFGYTKDYQNKKVAVLAVIGAPDILLKRCSRIVQSDGSDSEFINEKRLLVEQKINKWSFLGLRIVLLCKMYIPLDDLLPNISKWFKTCFSLSYVGSIAFRDPPKMKVYDSIVAIRKLGLRVIMATGDYSITAASIAKEVGILSNRKYDTIHKIRNPNHVKANSIVLNGSEIDKMTKQEWFVVCRNYNEIVLSRATPKHKLIFMREFQLNGFSTMMVGDGLNDLLSFKFANISVAMASGSRIVSEIAKIVLLDNDFSYIHQMILTGKQTFANIKKMFLYFTIASSFTQAITTLFSTLLGIPNLFSNYCLLIICLITDAIPAVTFLFEAPNQYQKENSNEKLVDWRIFVHGWLILGPLTTFLIYVNAFLYLALYTEHTPGQFLFNYIDIIDTKTQNSLQTVSFYSIVCMQSFGNIWAIRARNISIFKSAPFKGPRRNIPMVVSALGVYLFVIILINVPWINQLIGTSPIPWPFYFIPFGYSAVIIGLNEIRLLFTRFKFLEKIFAW